MRGRGNNGGGNNPNRKGPNPLTRNYESNGPDVKIRGSAQQIAEKYTALARDAQSSGDRVMAENYLQHAEHYNRIIAAAQAQMPIQHQVQHPRDDFSDDQDEDRDEFESVGNVAPAGSGGEAPAQQQVAPSPAAPLNNGSGPQPVIEGTPAEVALNAEAGAQNGGGRHRERRPHTPRHAPAAAPEGEAAPEASPQQANGGDGEHAPAPRRGRRPRRGERRPDQAEAGSAGQGGEDAATAAPAPTESSGGEAALTSAES
jgi:hypothetical protein